MCFQDQLSLNAGQSIAECSKRAFSNTSIFIKLPFVIKTFVLSIFEWPLKTGFTVFLYYCLGQLFLIKTLHKHDFGIELHRQMSRSLFISDCRCVVIQCQGTEVISPNYVCKG